MNDITALREISAGMALPAEIENDLEDRGLILQTDQPYATITAKGRRVREGFRGWDAEGHRVVVGWVKQDGSEYLIPLTLCCNAGATCDERGHMVCKRCYQDCSASCGIEGVIEIPVPEEAA